MTPEQKAKCIAFRMTFGSESGKIVLAELKRVSGYGEQLVRSTSIDKDLLLYRAARVDLVQDIIDGIEADLDEKPPETAITKEPE